MASRLAPGGEQDEIRLRLQVEHQWEPLHRQLQTLSGSTDRRPSILVTGNYGDAVLARPEPGTWAVATFRARSSAALFAPDTP